MTASDPTKATLEIRLAIARQRRRVDRRIGSIRREAQRLLSVRTYLTRYPAWALTALGAALTGTTSVLRGRWPQRLGLALFQRVGKMLLRRFAPGRKPPTTATAPAAAESLSEEKDGHGI